MAGRVFGKSSFSGVYLGPYIANIIAVILKI